MVDIIFHYPFLGAMGDHSKKKPGTAMCVGCGSQIHDQFILRVSPDLEWHAACLKCAECNQYLDETCTCFVRDGKTYCKRDYVRLFGIKCAQCQVGFSSSDLVMRARDSVGVSGTSHWAEGTQAKGRISGPKLQGRQPGRNHSVPRRPSLSQVGFFGVPECSERRDGPKQAFRSRRVSQSGSCAGSQARELFPFPSGVALRFPPLPLKPHLLTQGFAHPAGRSWVFLGAANTGSGRQPSLRTHVHKQAEKTTRVRTVLNEKQLHTLRTCYAANPRPDALMKEQLVEMTGLSPRVIRVWFQNKRCKDKKKSILMKQLQQQQHSDKASLQGLTGTPLVAGSPIRHENAVQGSAVEVQTYQPPWKALSEFALQSDLDQPAFQQLVSFSESGSLGNSSGSDVTSLSSQLPDTPNSMVPSPVET
uniref:insulin gene enhancer protein ISL-2 n=1 Tax=Myodes glareolus TaxID=447135 RepID=UPI00201FC391|nr:insulin gene enhancer protein ISL-2 [Myodes glareolus]